jgi:hypothetical protein
MLARFRLTTPARLSKRHRRGTGSVLHITPASQGSGSEAALYPPGHGQDQLRAVKVLSHAHVAGSAPLMDLGPAHGGGCQGRRGVRSERLAALAGAESRYALC